ncbi:MAG: hypothetical protein A2W23_09795 [Planctomycetes bacterium RBG_16_43_13]|nr:MAG: hypothetical protein A2W23_09795 [Planctomycetes bacterium RBG_16_43_13]
MSVDISAIRTNKDLDRFIKLPWQIYKGDKNWVPPLISEERKLLDRGIHPFHKHAEVEYFLAVKDGKLVGRIAPIVNHRHNEFHNERTGFFGFFECVNDQTVAKTLLDTAEQWLKSKNMGVVRGPCNFSTNETCGLLVEGFQWQPFIMMTYNPAYYIDLITSAGYQKAMDLLAYFILAKELINEKFKRVAEKITVREAIKIREINIRNFDKELETIKYIYNNAWSKNWGFIPMTDEEFYFGAKDMKSILLPEFEYIAEVNGEPAGFALALPDINHILKKINGRLFPFGWLYFPLMKRKIPVLRVVALGIVHKFQYMGIGTLFYLKLIEEAMKRGYKGAELSWVLETNEQMNKPIRDMGGKPYKVYRIYEKEL